MSSNQYSVDGGITWIDVTDGLRFVFREAIEESDGCRDLLVNITEEGIILDLQDAADGEVMGTGSLAIEDLVAMTS
jgi:hypothetical protein